MGGYFYYQYIKKTTCMIKCYILYKNHISKSNFNRKLPLK